MTDSEEEALAAYIANALRNYKKPADTRPHEEQPRPDPEPPLEAV